jgi:heterodisulfide reductase subunit A2
LLGLSYRKSLTQSVFLGLTEAIVSDKRTGLKKDLKKIGSITVIGGGIAGIQATLDAANAGFKVHLVEEKPNVGGIMAQLDKTFPTDDCAACMMGPKLAEMANHPNIEIWAYTEVLEVEGEAGRFRLTLKKKARAIDPEKCIGCGLCAEKCPKKVPDPFNLGLTDRKAVYLPYPQAIPLVYTIDKQVCRFFADGQCRLCEKLCPTKAVDFDQKDQTLHIETGAVILAGGIEPFDALRKVEFGYGRWPNVLTSLEYERILSAAGPYGGHIRRISDGKPPRKTAWLQCVGSRDPQIGQGYCSSVCCMSAIKQALITKEQDSRNESVIFYNDLRAYGKGFDRFYERAEHEHQVRFVRSMISRIAANPKNDTLTLAYLDSDRLIQEENYDLVVLSVGLCAHPSADKLARQMGLKLDDYGFCLSEPLNMVKTSREGIFVCGSLQGPKDIPDSVQQGSSAAAQAMSLLSESRGTMVQEIPRPVERDVSREKARIGVFICHCGINIAGVVDVKAVAEYARSLPEVIYAADCLFACSTDQQNEIRKAVTDQGLNRIVVAACTPRTHEPFFQDTLRQAGLNPYLFELANIREHDAWVHRLNPSEATQKAKDLVRMAISRARLLKPLQEKTYPVVQRALVVGGGLAGLTAAMAVAEQGYEAVLVEQSSELGGQALTLYYTEDGANPAEYVHKLISQIRKERLITLFTEAQVVEAKGTCGHFTTTILIGDETREIDHGVTIVAVGGQEYEPDEYHFGSHPRVITRKAFETLLALRPEEAKGYPRVAMIQCVGSREKDHLYCSRICCTGAVKNSLKLKSLNPEAQVSILYRDLRTFGLRESYYRQARLEGVRFFQYGRDEKPKVTIEGDGLAIIVWDQQLRVPVRIDADLLVLNTAIRPNPKGQRLAETLKLPLDQDGFFMEAHPKLRPLDFIKPGIFLCGLAQGPKWAVESMAQARGAVSRAMSILSRKRVTASGMIAQVDRGFCRACGECEKACLFEAVKIEEDEDGRQSAVINPSLCTGCGACNVACPTGAVSPAHFEDGQIEGMIRAFK